MTMDLNIDLGELAHEDPELYELCSIANIACGGHAGDEDSMRLSIRRAKAAQVRVSAHPGYPDKANFGRVPMTIFGADLRYELMRQIGTLSAIAAEEGVKIQLVKAHGALYHEVARHHEAAVELVEAALEILGPGITFIGLPGSALASVAESRGLGFLPEGFADRGYDREGQVLPRGLQGSLLNAEEAAEQAGRLIATGRFGTLCIHGDGPQAVESARRVRGVLDGSGHSRAS